MNGFMSVVELERKAKEVEKRETDRGETGNKRNRAGLRPLGQEPKQPPLQHPNTPTTSLVFLLLTRRFSNY
jgi:hypothetical protein